MPSPVCRRPRSLIVYGVLLSGLTSAAVLGTVVPAHAAPGTHAAVTAPDATIESAVSDAAVRVEIGNGLAAVVGGDSDGLLLETDQAGLTWDSTIADENRVERFGPGWTWGTAYIKTEANGGGSLYVPRHGLSPIDPDTASGVAGSGVVEFVFTRESGTLPARDGLVPARPYVAKLHYAQTGTTEYFDQYGNAITTIDATGNRTDRDFSDPLAGVNTKHLRSLIDPAGKVTTDDYEKTRVTHPDGATATFGLSRAGVSRIITANATDTEHHINELFYGTSNDGINRIDFARQLGPTANVLAEAVIGWNESLPGTVDMVSHSWFADYKWHHRVAYERR